MKMSKIWLLFSWESWRSLAIFGDGNNISNYWKMFLLQPLYVSWNFVGMPKLLKTFFSAATNSNTESYVALKLFSDSRIMFVGMPKLLKAFFSAATNSNTESYIALKLFSDSRWGQQSFYTQGIVLVYEKY